MAVVVILLLVGVLQPRLCSTYPRFLNLNSIIPVRENIPKGTEVMRLEVSGDDVLTLTVEYPLGHVPINNRTFQIITVEANLDYERVSVYQVPFTLTETVSGVMHSQPLKRVVTLRLEDVNDNAPEFRNLPYAVSVPENSLLGTQVFSVNVFDRDSGFGKILEYTITGGNDKGLFYMISVETPNITLNGTLDYEREKVYLLYVNATDNYLNPDRREPRLSTRQPVLISVLDVQDTPPYFGDHHYATSVPENVPQGTVILTVAAEDGDRQKPRAIKYYFSEGNVPRSSIMNFAISADTGVITTTSSLDRENLPFSTNNGIITLFVQAQEVPFPEETGFIFNARRDASTAPVTIEVTDVDDNAPTFSSNLAAATVLENTLAGFPVRMASVVTVSDPDLGRNGTFSLVLRKDGQVFTDFYVLPQEANGFAAVSLYVNNAQLLDYEVIKSISFQVIAVSQTSPIKMSVLNVTVSILDANDNYPQFLRSSYDAVIPENCPNNTPVIIAKAVDVDAKDYGSVTYVLQGSERRFRVDSRSGEIFTNCLDCMDRERIPDYVLTVTAIDGGGLASHAVVNVRLSDVNDNAPKFLRPTWNAFLRENSWRFRTPVVVQAIDEDDPIMENSRLTYSITGGDPYGYFVIDSRTGNMTVRQPADTEQFWGQPIPIYLDVIVTASDHGRIPLSGSAVVRVVLEDANDNAPLFTTLPAEVSVMENVAIGSVVHTVAGIDRDSYAPNNQTSFVILNGSQGLFQINALTGNVTVAGLLDKEQESTYRLVIVCSDLGIPSLSTQSTLTVHVTDINDKSPRFSAEPPVFTVVENATLGTAVGRLTAVDPDASQPLVYSIDLTRSRSFDPSSRSWKVLTEPHFGIGRTNGSIWVASSLDREKMSRFDLNVVAKDMSASPPQASTGLVVISILDINDNIPHFDRKEYTASVIYGDVPQKTILRLQDHVIDPDLNPAFWFYLKGVIAMQSEMQAAFARDPLIVTAAGEVRTALTFPPNIRGEIVFAVGVNDSLGRGDTATVRVHTIGREHLALLTIDRPAQDNMAIRDWLVRVFKETTGVLVGIDRIEVNAGNKARSDVYLYVPASNTEDVWTTEDVLNLIEETPSLRNALTTYGMQDTRAIMLAEKNSSRKDYVVATAICAILAVLLATAVVVCFVARRKLQRKLREAHSVSADTHTLGFDLGPIDTRAVPVSLSISSSLKRPINGSNPIFRDQNDDHDDNEHNSNWMRRNGGYDSKQQKFHKQYCGSEHRNSMDENVIAPLTSCESGEMSHSFGGSGVQDTSAILPRPRTPAVTVSEHPSPMRSLKMLAAKATPPMQSRSSLRRGASRDQQYFNSHVVDDQATSPGYVANDSAASSASLTIDRLLVPLEPPVGFQTFSAPAPSGPKVLVNSAV